MPRSHKQPTGGSEDTEPMNLAGGIIGRGHFKVNTLPGSPWV